MPELMDPTWARGCCVGAVREGRVRLTAGLSPPSAQGIYSCFSGVQSLASPAHPPSPDLTAGSAHASVLKMLQAARDHNFL